MQEKEYPMNGTPAHDNMPKKEISAHPTFDRAWDMVGRVAVKMAKSFIEKTSTP